MNDTERKVEIYKIIEEIWKESLEIDVLVKDKDFFMQSGDSLKFIRLLGDIEDRFGIILEFEDFEDKYTLERLEELIDEAIKEKKNDNEKDTSVELDITKSTTFPLTNVQSAYLLGRDSIYELGGVSTHTYYEVETRFDLQKIQDAVNYVIQHQSMLRTVMQQDGTQRTLHEVEEYKMCVLDLRKASKQEQEDAVLELRSQMQQAQFDPYQYPLFELKGIRISDTINHLCIGLDLLVFDGVSIYLFLKEIMQYVMHEKIYEPLKFTFQDYVLLEKEKVGNKKYELDKKYWMDQIDDFPQGPTLPQKQKLVDVENPHFKRLKMIIPKNRWSNIKSIMKDYGITSSSLLCTLYGNVLAYWSGEKRFGLNVTVFNRIPYHKDVELLIGDFTKVMLLPIELQKEETILEQVKVIQSTILNGMSHSSFDGIEFSRELSRKRQQGTNASIPIVFTAMMNQEKYLDGFSIDDFGEEKFGISQTTQVCLDCQITERAGNLIVVWDYVDEVFEEKIISQMFAHLEESILCLENRESTGYKFDLSEEDRNLLNKYNQTCKSIEPKRVLDCINEYVKEGNNDIAVKDKTEQLTYSQLNNLSNMVAKRLIDLAVGSKDYVGVIANRSVKTIVNIVGIIKAGAAYIPINVEYPKERQQYILEHSGCKTYLTEESVDLSKRCEKCEEVIPDVTPEDVAYVIYTSGSTGKPKGVIITNDAVCNTVLDINDKWNITKDDRILGVSSFCFDLSVYDIMGSLFSGATLVLIPEVQDIRNVMHVIVREEITVWNSVPAIMELLIDEVEKRNSLNRKNYWDMQQDEVIIVNNECTLRLCLLSGDWIPVALPNKIQEYFPFAEVISLGGATEASIWSIYHEVNEEDGERISIPYGIPLSNQRIYILNEELDSCPVGVQGEIYIGGRGVAQAYLNDNIKTEEAFLETEELGYIYKTGDYGVMHRCGEIEFLGRKDFQVKIRGYRIELDEIESVLAKHDNIERVIIKAEEKESKKYLCAFYVGEEVEEEELEKLCKGFLPDYMIPQFYIKIKTIPLTANGKVNRKALSLPNNLIKKEEVVSPETETQKKLVQLWSEALNEHIIGITDEFFNLGGDSITMIKILSAIEKEFCVKVSYKQFLYCSNIEKLAGYIDQNKGEITKNEIVKNEPIIWEKENVYKPFKLTEVQNAYFMGRNKIFEMGGISTHAYYEVVIELDLERFEKALNEVIRVQPMLRTVFFADGTQQVKGVEETGYTMKVEDIRDLSNKEKEDKIQKQRERMSHAQFNISQFPLFEFSAYKISDEKNYMFIGFDLLIADGASMLILLNQIMTVYEGNLLPQIEFTFRDYVLNLDNIKRTDKYKEDRKYWLQKLKDIPEAAQLPMKVLPESIETPHFSRKTMNIPAEEWNELKELFVKEGITSSVFLCTLYAGLISQWSARKEHTLNLTVFQRYPFHKDVQKMIGDFTSVMLLPVSFDNKNRTIWENAKIIQESIAEGFEHSAYEGIELIREIAKERGMEKKAVMPLVFTSILYNNEELNKQNSIDTIGDIMFSGSQTSQVFLDYQVMESKNGLSITWDYVEELFEEKMIDKMFKQYRKMIREASNLTCITLGKEEGRFINQYNNTSKSFSQTNLLQGYLESVEKYPTNVALIHENKHITYEELDRFVNKSANMLVDNGVKKGNLVGVFAYRNIDTIAYILAILKVGAGYIPISLDYPKSRVDFIKEQSQCTFLFDNSFDKNVLDGYKDVFEIAYLKGNETAYLIYTSGSTGEPKAVEITHRACVNTIVDMNDKLEITCKDKFIGISSLCFDLSIYDIFGALQSGASLVIINDQRDIQNIYEVIKQEQVTIYNSVPAIMDMLVKETKGKDNALRYALLSGDFIPTYLPNAMKDVFPNVSCMSLGGATECSIWSIYYPIKELKKDWTTIPYGIPLANQTVYILNTQGEDCPIGVIGEICIGGLGLAKGYFKDKENTEKSFFVHPTYGRIYRTGDLGKLDDDGLIWIIGRMDNQVKVNGYRIELEEIINVIEKNQEVSRCVVKLNEDNQLITYIEPKRYISNMEHKKSIIKQQIKQEEVNIEQSNNYEEIYEFVKDINRVAEGNMLEFFKKHGLWAGKTASYSLEKVQRTITDHIECYDMITKWVNALVKNEVLIKDGDKYCLTNKINSDGYKRSQVRMKEYQNGQWKHLLQYFNDCNSQLDSLILKEVNPLTLLFPDGGYQTVDEVYCKNPVTYPANQIARQAIKNYLEQRDKDKGLNVLEVGAGVGSTTQYILDLFIPEKTVYHYTDISDGFTKYAAEKFKEYSFLEFGVINIDNDFESQGIELQSVDLIIAANVIHDAKNILQCLTSLKKVLSPEGMVVFVEGTEVTNYELTTVSFLEGLSTYEDERVGKMTPFLTDDEWKDKMITAGFEDPFIYPTKESKSASLKVKTIVTFNKEFTKLDREVLNEYVKKYLPTYMLPKQYVILERLPLTSNGKVDYKALKLIESQTEDKTRTLNQFVLPRNETDKLIVEICSDVFGLENISIDDNIYDIGGDSIKFIRILGILRNKGYKININELFTLSTIREISDQITK